MIDIMAQETIDLLIEGGKAKPGPATAPKLGAYKINMGKLFQEVNDKTKSYSEMNVPVKIIINKENSSYAIKIGTPPVSSLIRKEMGLKKIASEKKEEPKTEEKKEKKPRKEEKKEEPKKEDEVEKKEDTEKEVKEEKTEESLENKKPKEKVIVGNFTMEQAIKVTKMKEDALLAKTFKKAVKEIVASCVSMPITVEGKSAKEVLKDIDKGKYDNLLK